VRSLPSLDSSAHTSVTQGSIVSSEAAIRLLGPRVASARTTDVVAEEASLLGTRLQSKLAGFVCMKRRDGSIGSMASPIRPPPVVRFRAFAFYFFCLAVANLASARLELEGHGCGPRVGPLFVICILFFRASSSHPARNPNAKDLLAGIQNTARYNTRTCKRVVSRSNQELVLAPRICQ